MSSKNVADLRLKGPDAMDEEILVFYGRRPPEYAVYGIKKRVMIHFADSKKDADEQRQKVAKLNPLRGEINGLIDGWRSAPEGSSRRSRADRYDRRVGDSLVVAFEGDPDTAEMLLKAIKQDILAERIARGRVEYLLAAFAAGVLGLLVILEFTVRTEYSPQAVALWRAAAAGSFGAFFSIALAMRSRTVLPDLERTGNIMDAVLRVGIGLVAGAVLMALITADLVRIQLGDANVSEPLGWLSILIIGFVAGFSERLVPDLLDKTSAKTQAARAEGEPAAAPHAQPPAQPPAEAAAAEAEQEDVPEEDPLPEEAAADACVSDLDLPDELVTEDPALPAAAGGVERPAQPGGGA